MDLCEPIDTEDERFLSFIHKRNQEALEKAVNMFSNDVFIEYDRGNYLSLWSRNRQDKGEFWKSYATFVEECTL